MARIAARAWLTSTAAPPRSKMLNACGQTDETLKPYAETIDLDGVPVQTINLEGLLLTKRTDRDKDVSDRIVLEKALERLRDQ